MVINLDKAFDILPWDSGFFKFKVARIKENVSLALDNPVLNGLFENNINLVYYSSPNQLKVFENRCYTISLVDKKITYAKEVSSRQHNSKVVAYNQSYPDEKLVNLAISSGVYSRFNTDKRIRRESFETLYTLWITKSVSKEIAEEVLVYKEDNEIQGFVTVGKKGNRGDIGIIAVDAAFRGKGIGKSLMFEAENYYYNKTNKIQVVTQGDNIPACKLYESCGYAVEKSEYFYHLWRLDQ